MEKETIKSFLHRFELDDKVDKFKEEDIDLDLLLTLSEDQLAEILKAMNISLGKQMQIRNAIKEMKPGK